jgi:hypothetical protein
LTELHDALAGVYAEAGQFAESKVEYQCALALVENAIQRKYGSGKTWPFMGDLMGDSVLHANCVNLRFVGTALMKYHEFTIGRPVRAACDISADMRQLTRIAGV